MPASTSGQGHRLALSTVRLHPCRACDSFQGLQGPGPSQPAAHYGQCRPITRTPAALPCLSCHPAPLQASPLFQATYLVPRPLAAAACRVQMRALSLLHEPSRCTATTQGPLPGCPPLYPPCPPCMPCRRFNAFLAALSSAEFCLRRGARFSICACAFFSGLCLAPPLVCCLRCEVTGSTLVARLCNHLSTSCISCHLHSFLTPLFPCPRQPPRIGACNMLSPTSDLQHAYVAGALLRPVCCTGLANRPDEMLVQVWQSIVQFSCCCWHQRVPVS